jgi:hypothetical protein
MQESEVPTREKTKRRHGCLTAVLVIIIIFSTAVIIGYLTGMGVFELPGSPPGWAIPALIILLILQIACVTAILRWKKWGFWGYCAVNMAGLIVDVLMGVSLLGPFLSVTFGIAILYGVLQLGGEDKGWTQLE